jgi:N-acetylneuraminate synthase
MGASVIEKHLTLSREDGGPDADFSMEPNEFKQLVTECRRAYAARGKIKYGSEGQESSAKLRRSLYYNYDMQQGEMITDTSIRTARPFAEVSPQDIDKFLGQVIVNDIKSGEPVTWESINANDVTDQ